MCSINLTEQRDKFPLRDVVGSLLESEAASEEVDVGQRQEGARAVRVLQDHGTAGIKRGQGSNATEIADNARFYEGESY